MHFFKIKHSTIYFIIRTKQTQAQEIFYFDFQERSLSNLSKANNTLYKTIYENKVESRITQASDGEELFSWVIYPPNFDPDKKYPTLLADFGLSTVV